MFRSCISLLVTIGLFASQLAAVPHAHGEIAPADREEHDARPHFHGLWGNGGQHAHTHDGHAHSHSTPPQKPASLDPEGTPGVARPSEGIRNTHHDATAVYVPLQVASCPATSSTACVVLAWQLAACADLAADPGIVSLNIRSAPGWHPPDEVLDASGTYLTLRNLRI